MTRALLVAVAAATAFACGEMRREPAAIERLRAAVADFVAGKPTPAEPEIDALFAQVDADVAQLRAEAAADPSSDAAARADAMRGERFALWQTYVKGKIERLRRAAEDTVRAVGKQMGQGVEEAGRQMQESMEPR